MIEEMLQLQAQAEASRRGLLWHHCPKSHLCRGIRGLPDLIALGDGGLLMAELKQPGRRRSPGQNRWAWALRAAGIRYVLADSLADVTMELEEISCRSLS